MFRTVLIYVLLLLSLMGVFSLSGCKEKESNLDEQERLPGDFQKAPAFTLLDVDGKQVSLSKFEGKVTLINFWATWCVPCRRETPDLVELYNEQKAAGFEMIGISVDDEKTRKDIAPFMKEVGMNYTSLLADGKVQTDYQLFGLPSTFILDRAHRIRFSHVGAQPKELFEEEVKKLLAESPPTERGIYNETNLLPVLASGSIGVDSHRSHPEPRQLFLDEETQSDGGS